MSATLKHIAEATGLSTPTVSLILNGHGSRYRPGTREKVIQAAKQLNYRRDAVAHRIGHGSTRRDAVGFLIRSESASHLANTPAYEFICGVNDVLLEHQQFMVMVKLNHLHENGDSEQPRLIAERFIDGLIVETGLPKPLAEAVDRYDIPLIWLNSERQDAYDCVWPDEAHAARLLTEHLIQMGHRRIMYVGSLEQSAENQTIQHFSIEARPHGYHEAMREAGLSPEVVIVPDGLSQHQSRIAELLRAGKAEGNPVTAMVSHGLSSVPKLQQTAQSLSLECPRDVSIVSAEDMHVIRRAWPEITGVSCDRYTMGRWAVEMMLDKIESDGRPQPSRVFKGELIRGATASSPSR